MPKMVMKAFGKRNFMQSMGRPKHALKTPFFFPFSRLPNVFALCSFQVPNGFPIFSPTFSPYFLTFICLGKWRPPFTYMGGQKGRNCTVQNRVFCFEESPLFLFFWSDGLIKLTCCPKKKLKRDLI